MRETHEPLPEVTETVMRACIGCGITVHRELGPGFAEKIYHRAFCLELASRGIKFETEKPILVKYRQWSIPGQKVDLVVDGLVLVELKTVPRLRSLHRNQVLSYLKTTSLRAGLLLNFNSSLMKNGMQRVVL
jgi:GxxExxY protein